MAKPTRRFVCANCAAVTTKWSGQCGGCGEWNTISEDQTGGPEAIGGRRGQAAGGRIITLNGLDAEVKLPPRLKTGIDELDGVLGGGLVRGSVVLISGEPGIGKSTLLIQAIAQVARQGHATAYISGEEAADQVRLRAQRLGLGDAPVKLGHETMVRDILTTMGEIRPAVLVLDSIQTMVSDAVEGAAGGISQIRASGEAIIAYAKASGCAVILVGHVTKNGDLAGPRHLEHMVDAVLSFEGDRSHQFRLLRAVKNRFGATDEVGVFEMADVGLREVKNPSSLFLIDRDEQVAGACVLPTVEGGRAILIEVQALVVKRQDQGYPRRACVGWDAKRLDMILAILESRYGIPFAQADVYLNVAGGYRLNDPGADLAIASAIASAYFQKPLPVGTVAFGELTLSGEIRPIPHMGLRMKESSRLGFDSAWTPRLTADVQRSGMKVREMKAFDPVADQMVGRT